MLSWKYDSTKNIQSVHITMVSKYYEEIKNYLIYKILNDFKLISKKLIKLNKLVVNWTKLKKIVFPILL